MRVPLALALTAACLATETGHAGLSAADPSAMESFLRSAEIVADRPASMGVTNSRVLTLSQGDRTHDAHMQTINKNHQVSRSVRGSFQLSLVDSYKHNIAAYRLDQLLGLNMIPAAVPRRYRGHDGAVSWWVDDAAMTEMDRQRTGREPPDAQRWSKQMVRMYVLDELIANSDRNQGNIVITEDWTVWLIDHSRAFGTGSKLADPERLDRCDRALFAAMKALDQERLERELEPYLSKVRRGAILKRRDAIVHILEEKIRQQGEHVVLYD